MTVIVTRPNPDAEGLLNRLYDSGLDVLHAPMMQIRAVNIQDQAKENLHQAAQNNTARLAFTSANGVRMLLAQIPEANEIPCFCVGKQTAQCAKDHGFQQITTAGGDVKSLVTTIEEQEYDKTLEWFHLRGHHHHGALVQTLRQKNYNAQAICGYNAEPSTRLDSEVIHAISEREVHSVLIYSPRTARLLELLLELHGLLEYCSTIDVYGLSPAVLQALQGRWRQKWSPADADAEALEAKMIFEGNRYD